jgi:4-amino-4-deoxy-L-arabinose transferase-like glycosyltransferase
MLKKNNILKHKFQILLFIIVSLAALLRFPFLDIFPPSMIQDEVGIGYSAISIAETGMDEWGIKFPLVFKSFGDYKAPVFIYTTALLYKIIGWHEVLPRITSAIAGLFIVLIGGLWTKKLFKSEELGLISALLLAINPWTIHLSRMALESNLGLAFFMAGLLFMSYASKSFSKIILSALFFSLSTYTFHSFRYIIVLFLLSTIFLTVVLNSRNLKKQATFLKNTFLILLISTLLSIPGFLSKGATSRLDQTLLFTSEKHIKLYEHYENNCHNTLIQINPKLTFICRLQYNKFSRLILIGGDSLVKHLSPGFYFFSGDNEPLRNPTGSGQFFVALFPVWMIGVLILLKEYKKHLAVIAGYLVALLPSTVSGDPHATRLSVLIPFFLFTIVLGYKFLRKYFKKFKYFVPLFILILLASASLHVVRYATDTFATHEITATYLSYAKKIARISHDYVEQGYTVYADHDLYPEPHIYYAYWNQIDPKITQESFLQVYEESAGFSRPKQFGEKLNFNEGNLQSFNCDDLPTEPTVFITNNSLKNVNPTKIISDNTELYKFAYIYEVKDLCL